MLNKIKYQRFKLLFAQQSWAWIFFLQINTGILIFISSKNFMLNWVEHEKKSFITLEFLCYFVHFGSINQLINCWDVNLFNASYPAERTSRLICLHQFKGTYSEGLFHLGNTSLASCYPNNFSLQSTWDNFTLFSTRCTLRKFYQVPTSQCLSGCYDSFPF